MEARLLSARFGISLVEDLGGNLEVPIFHNRVSKETYRDVEKHVVQKLSTQRAKILQLTGRLVLIQYVLATIHLYIMQFMTIPKYNLNRID